MSGFRVKHGMTKGLLAMMAVVSIGIFLFANHSAQAVDDWTLDNIQGNNITSSNNPGGYTNNTPSQSPDNSTNFSPAFGGGSSAITVNGSGFSMPDYDINAVEVSKGMMYSCYLSYAPDSWLYCWGYNYRGQLGDGTNATRATPVPIARGQISVGEIITAFSTGREHACVITSANKTYCWGYNHDGALGIGANSNEPYYAPVLVGQGDVSNGEYFKSISAGVNHTCAVSDRDKVYCWGNGSYGQLGQNNTMSYYAPKRVKTVSDGGSFVMPDNVKQVDVSSSAVSGSIGINSYSCAVAADDMVYCWGNNSFGQLGDNTIVQRNAPVRIHGMSGTIFHQVEATVYSTCALTSAGLIYCWGSNDRGQLGNGTTDNSSIPIAVTGGTVFREIGVSQSRSFCAISNDDVAYCWGMKYIGDGATTPSDANAVPTPLKTVSGGGTMPDGVISVSIGDGSSSNQNSSGCAVATDNKVYCWGYISNTAPFGDNSYPPNSGTAYVRGAPAQIVQFAELPKVQFDDIYGSECNSVVVLSANQLRCFSPSSISNGLHDILVTYHSETRTLPQSYMYKTIPNPLTNLTAVGKNKMVNLNWSWQDEKPYITSASFYVQCKRSDSSTWWSPTRSNCDTALQGNNFLSTGSTNSSSAIILGLQNGVSYDFRVQSSENSLSSVYVFYIYNVIPQASPYVPSSPTIVDAVVSSSGTGGSLYWTTPQYDGGSTITGYVLMLQCSNYYTNGDFVQNNVASYAVSTLTTTAGSCLSPTAPAQFAVVAINANGASEPSEIVTLQQNQPPSAPTNIKVNNVNNDQTMLSWTSPSNNGSAITSYEMRYSIESDFSDWTGTVGTDTCVSNTPTPPTTSCVTNSLTLGTQYYFQIRAINANGASDWSIIHASVVGAPDRPIISTVSTTTIDSNTSSIYVEWNPPNNNGAAITKYTLEYSTDPNFTPETTTTLNTGTTPNYTLTPATNGTIYYFRVLASNSRGDSPYSDPVQAIPYASPTISGVAPDTGLTLGNELITITGTNLNGTSSVTIGGLACLTFSVIDSAIINCLTPPNAAVGAKDVVVTNLGGSATEVGGFTYGDPQLTLNLDKTDLNITYSEANDFGTIKTDQQTATVKTDDPRGYVLNFSMQSAETALVHASLPTNQVAGSNALVNAQPLADNTWGYSLQNPNLNQWLGVPPSTNQKVLKTTTNQTTDGMTGAGDTTTVYFGAKITMTQLAGEYAGRMVYTVVGNY